MGITMSSVMGYLYIQVGEGAIQRSDIVLSYPPEFRKAVEEAVRDANSDQRSKVQYRLGKMGIQVEPEELYLYLTLRRQKVEYGDLYAWIRSIELQLHNHVREVLEKNHGDRWWRMLPLKVRQECSIIFEEDENEPSHRYCCTTFIHLKTIYEKLWPELSASLPNELARSKHRFVHELGFINKVRNSVMHPVKGLQIEEEAFRRVHTFALALTGAKAVTSENWGSVMSIAPRTATIQ